MSQDSPWPVVLCTNLLFAMWAASAPAQPLQFATHKDYSSGYGSASIAVGDLNGDGVPDLAVANSGANTVSVLLGNGDGTFQPAQTYAVDVGPAFVAIADFNRDGKPDLAIANTTAGTVAVLLGTGNGTFQGAMMAP